MKSNNAVGDSEGKSGGESKHKASASYEIFNQRINNFQAGPRHRLAVLQSVSYSYSQLFSRSVIHSFSGLFTRLVSGSISHSFHY